MARTEVFEARWRLLTGQSTPSFGFTGFTPPAPTRIGSEDINGLVRKLRSNPKQGIPKGWRLDFVPYTQWSGSLELLGGWKAWKEEHPGTWALHYDFPSRIDSRLLVAGTPAEIMRVVNHDFEIALGVLTTYEEDV